MEPLKAKTIFDTLCAERRKKYPDLNCIPFNPRKGNAEGAANQCRAFKNALHGVGELKRRCNKHAVLGRKFCHFHGGKAPTGRRLKWKRGRVSAYYSKHLGKSLAAAFDAQLRRAPSELLSLYEEIGVMRVAATQALALASVAFDNPQAGAASKAAAAQLVMDAMSQVAGLVERAAKIESMSEDKISIKSGIRLIDQIIRILHDVLGDENNDVIKLISEKINAEVRVPLEAVRGHKEDDTTIGRFPVEIGVVNVQVNKTQYNAEDPVAVRARSERTQETKMLEQQAGVPSTGLLTEEVLVPGAKQ